MRPSTIKDQLHERSQNFPKLPESRSDEGNLENFENTSATNPQQHEDSCDYLFINEGQNLYEGKSRAQSIFIWEACLALQQIVNQIELTNRFNEILFSKTES